MKYNHYYTLKPGTLVKIGGIPCEVLKETVVGTNTETEILPVSNEKTEPVEVE